MDKLPEDLVFLFTLLSLEFLNFVFSLFEFGCQLIPFVLFARQGCLELLGSRFVRVPLLEKVLADLVRFLPELCKLSEVVLLQSLELSLEVRNLI